MIALGFLLIVLGLFVAHGTGPVLALMGGGAILVFIGLSLLSARFVPGMARVDRLAGDADRGRDRPARARQRDAQPAADGVDRRRRLMIGLALVTLVSIMAAGIISNFKGAVNAQFGGDYAIVADNNFSPIPISAGAAAATGAGRDRGRQRPRRPGQGVRLDRQPDRASTPASPRRSRVNWIHGSQRTFAHARVVGSDRAQELREQARPVGRLAGDDPDPDRRPRDLPRPRHLRPAERQLARSATSRSRRPASTSSTPSRRTSSAS